MMLRAAVERAALRMAAVGWPISRTRSARSASTKGVMPSRPNSLGRASFDRPDLPRASADPLSC
ncbi:Hypothetical protein PFR_JS21-2_1523 [Propionibacterium freudenreichii]|uniref:Uncharacterized protein n=1 Tax=Propionibacterium freudenreichii TaxID=1744 RepID=A0A2C8AEM7_9ACTN|nr:Hypothetical protein RM25_0779 [Propionibacterium freudenreichii subsp. freudenreichii]MCT2989064.1 hypothetical protein [Propionibacterium freudenreichii]SPB30384.1 hypothetical protein MAJHIDBO_00682 [Propionibacterium freudenreichii subsp. shermanii]MCT3013699.1 hypothetical protein [Propionibacterium freudenreichii]MCT3016088.1 hypothetical protein [Propionibacterium freudenreichii]